MQAYAAPFVRFFAAPVTLLILQPFLRRRMAWRKTTPKLLDARRGVRQRSNTCKNKIAVRLRRFDGEVVD
jgi:hypothetical protein